MRTLAERVGVSEDAARLFTAYENRKGERTRKAIFEYIARLEVVEATARAYRESGHVDDAMRLSEALDALDG